MTEKELQARLDALTDFAPPTPPLPAPPAPIPAPVPTTPPSSLDHDYRTTTATTWRERAAEKVAEAKEALAAGKLETLPEDLGQMALNGVTMGGSSRLAGIGTVIGDRLTPSPSGTPPLPVDTAYEQGKAAQVEAENTALENHPIAGRVVQAAAGVVPLIATAGLGSAGVVPRAPGVLPGVANALRGAREFAATPTARLTGTNALAGALAEPSDDPKAMAESALYGAAGGAIVDKASRKVLEPILAGAINREGKGIISSVVRNEAGQSATFTSQRHVAKMAARVQAEVRGNPELRSALKEDAQTALDATDRELRKISAPRAAYYEELNAAAPPLSAGKLSFGILEASKRARNGTVEHALQEMNDDLVTHWFPKWKRTGMMDSSGNVNVLAVRDWVSQAQTSAAKTLGTIAETEHAGLKGILKETAEDVWNAHLDSVAKTAPKVVDKIREYDRHASALLTMEDALKQRKIKEDLSTMGIGTKGQRFGELTAGGLGIGALAEGHSGLAAGAFGTALASKYGPRAASEFNDRALVPIARAAQAGKPWAEVVKMAAERGMPASMARIVYERALRNPEEADE
jgi:hypothetical protein